MNYICNGRIDFEIFQNQSVNFLKTRFRSNHSFFDIGLKTLRRLPDNSPLTQKIPVYNLNLSRVYAVSAHTA